MKEMEALKEKENNSQSGLFSCQSIDKRCAKCKTYKPVLEYYKNKSKKDGYNSYCKQCIREFNLTRKKKD